MDKLNRRHFLQTSASVLAASLIPGTRIRAAQSPQTADSRQHAPTVSSNEGKKPLRLGLILGAGKDPDVEIAKVKALGLPTCQVYVENFEMEQAGRLRTALDKYGVEATSLVVGGPGKEVWDFYLGPLTIGLVPPEYASGPDRADQERLRFREEMRDPRGPDPLRIHSGKSE